MSKYEKIYQRLREEFSDEEIAAGYVFPDDLGQKEKEEIERAKFERIENIIELMPIVFLLLGIIIMSILYKIFM